MNRLTAFLLLALAATPAAADTQSGLYIGLGAGSTAATASLGDFSYSDDLGAAFSGSIGYAGKFGDIVSGIEVATTVLSDTGDTVVAGNLMLGYDIARVTPYIKAGAAWNETTEFGLSAGIGARFGLTDHLALDAGYDLYAFEVEGIDFRFGTARVGIVVGF